MNTLASLLLASAAVFASTATADDFDGDRRADLAVWRPSDATWYTYTSSGLKPRSMFPFYIGFSRQWGLPADIPASGNIAADPASDLTVYRPSTRQWFVLASDAVSVFVIPMGTGAETPVAADYDGDGLTDLALFEPATATWLIRKTSDLQAGTQRLRGFGPLPNTRTVPLPADYDGDGRADLNIVSITPLAGGNALFQWRHVLSSGSPLQGGGFMSSAQDIPVAADLDGDGKVDRITWSPSNGVWHIQKSGNGFVSVETVQWGLNGDIPLCADFNGDGKAELTVWRPSNGTWYILSSASPIRGAIHQGPGWAIQWGLPGDIPLPTSPAR